MRKKEKKLTQLSDGEYNKSRKKEKKTQPRVDCTKVYGNHKISRTKMYQYKIKCMSINKQGVYNANNSLWGSGKLAR